MGIFGRQTYLFLRNMAGLAMLVFGVTFLLSFAYRGQIPLASQWLPEIQREPIQSQTAETPFTLNNKDRDYQITPVANYELWGLVVSKNKLDSMLDPKSAEHHIGVRDFCVIWGDNVTYELSKSARIYNDNQTCNFHFRDPLADNSFFRNDQIANNHLLALSDDLKHSIKYVQIGDQIHLKGLLVDYGFVGQKKPLRVSSLVRDDSGIGTSEVILVQSLDILHQPTPWLNWLVFYSEYLFVGSLLLFFVLPFFKVCHNDLRDKRIAGGKHMIELPPSLAPPEEPKIDAGDFYKD